MPVPALYARKDPCRYWGFRRLTVTYWSVSCLPPSGRKPSKTGRFAVQPQTGSRTPDRSVRPGSDRHSGSRIRRSRPVVGRTLPPGTISDAQARPSSVRPASRRLPHLVDLLSNCFLFPIWHLQSVREPLSVVVAPKVPPLPLRYDGDTRPVGLYLGVAKTAPHR